MSNPITNVASGLRTSYDLMFQVSPIIFNGGVAAQTVGGLLPALSFLGSFLFGQDTLPDVRFVPLPGATVIDNSLGEYPFANQVVAANAIIVEPKIISLMMISPVNSENGYLTKMAAFLAFKTSLDSHMAAGGTFHIMTPSYPYMDCLLVRMTDVTSGTGKQQQVQWQLDFRQPLITQSAAQSVLSGLLNKIAGGQQVTDSSWSDVSNAVGGPQTFPVTGL